MVLHQQNKYLKVFFYWLLHVVLSVLLTSFLEVRAQTNTIDTLMVYVVSLTKLEKTNRIAAILVFEDVAHPDLYFLSFGTMSDIYLVDENGQKWEQLYLKYLPEDSPPARRVVEVLFQPTGPPNGSLFTMYLTRNVFQVDPDVIKDLRLEISR